MNTDGSKATRRIFFASRTSHISVPGLLFWTHVQTDLRRPGMGLLSQAESWRSRRVGGAAVLTYDIWEMQWVMWQRLEAVTGSPKKDILIFYLFLGHHNWILYIWTSCFLRKSSRLVLLRWTTVLYIVHHNRSAHTFVLFDTFTQRRNADCGWDCNALDCDCEYTDVISIILMKFTFAFADSKENLFIHRLLLFLWTSGASGSALATAWEKSSGQENTATAQISALIPCVNHCHAKTLDLGHIYSGAWTWRAPRGAKELWWWNPA